MTEIYELVAVRHPELPDAVLRIRREDYDATTHVLAGESAPAVTQDDPRGGAEEAAQETAPKAPAAESAPKAPAKAPAKKAPARKAK